MRSIILTAFLKSVFLLSAAGPKIHQILEVFTCHPKKKIWKHDSSFEVVHSVHFLYCTSKQPVQTGPGAHPASCTMGTGSFLGVESGRGVTLTPHPLLVLRS
jgi:hypothetical protein